MLSFFQHMKNIPPKVLLNKMIIQKQQIENETIFFIVSL